MTSPHSLSLQSAERIDTLCDDFEAAWTQGRAPSLEQYLAAAPPDERESTFLALFRVEIELRRRAGEVVDPESHVARFPDLSAQIHNVLSERQAVVDTSVSLTSQTVAAKPGFKSAEEAEEPLPATIGRFQVLEKIGSGAFGVVVRARDPQLDREVAIKLPRRGTLQANEMERFLREAKASANMQHLNICPVYEVGTADGRPYIVMSLVPGKSLAEHLKQTKEPMAIRQAVLTVRKLAQALALAHDKGIVHRDLKPANVMLDRERKDVVIMDFGLARVERHDDIGLTASGMVLGTPAYMSPEQARGDQKAIGPATDIYSLGVILHELLTRQRPFEGSMAEVLGKILHVEAPGPAAVRPEVGQQLDGIVRMCMAKEPKDRYKSMRELTDALTKHLKSRGTEKETPAAETRTDDMFATAASPERQRGETGSPVADASGSQGRRVGILLGFGFVAALILYGIIFFAQTPSAEVYFHLKDVDPSDATLSFTLDKKPIAATDLSKPRELDVGAHEFIVKRDRTLLHKYGFKVSKDAGPRIEFDDPNIPPPEPPHEAERELASWILKQGGKIVCSEKIPQSVDEFNRLPELKATPSEPFKLVAIYLEDRDFDDEAYRLLAGARNLVKLHVGNSNFDDRGLAAIANCESMRELFLAQMKTTDAGLKHLAKMPQLVHIFIEDTLIQGDGLADLAHLPLRWLTLGFKTSPAGVDAVAKFDKLEYLCLRGEGINDEAVRKVAANMRRLKQLHVTDCGIGDRALGQIGVLKTLTEVKITNTAVTPLGRERLRMALPKCNVLPERRPEDDADMNRAVAEWVLSNRDAVKVTTGTPPDSFEGVRDTPDISNLQQLPAERFQLIGVILQANQGTDEHIIRLRDLQNLRFALLRGGEISNAGVKMAAQHRHLRVLQLDSPLITSAAAMDLGRLTELVDLHVAGTRLDDNGLRDLASLPELRALGLRDTKVSGAGAVHLAGLNRLSDLILGGAALTDEGLRGVASLKQLKVLKIEESPKVTDDGLAHLKAIPALDFLDCTTPAITNVGLAHIAELSRLKQLWLTAPRVDDKGFESLARLDQVHSLKVTDCTVSGAAVKSFAQMGPLQTLVFSRSRVTESTCGALDALPHLVALHFEEVPVTNAMLTAMKPPPKLTELSLFRSQVTDEGLQRLYGLKTLKMINLNGSPITAEGLAALRKALPDCSITPASPGDPAAQLMDRLQRMGAKITQDENAPDKPLVVVDFYEAKQKAGDALLVELQHLPSLRRLVLWGCGDVTDDGLVALQKLPNLRTLDLGATRISDKGVENLKPLTELAELNLSYTQVRSDGLVHLAGMKKLTRLGLDHLPVTDDGLQPLQGLEQLNHLNLLSSKVEGRGLRHLAGMKKLRQLWLANSPVNDDGLQHLESLKELRQLLLQDTRVTQAGADRLKKALPECEISLVTPARAAAQWLLDHGGAFAVTVEGSNKDLGILQGKAELPKEPFFIHYIEATQSKLSDENLAELAPGLTKLQAILGNNTKFTGTGFANWKQFDLRHLDLNNGSIDDEGLKAISRINTINFLSLEQNRNITDDGLDDLHQLVNLNLLGLNRTQISDAGLASIAKCPRLRLLHIAGTNIGDDGLKHLAGTNIVSLNMHGTKVTSAGLAHLKGLDLEDISAAQTAVDDDGLQYFADMTNFRRAYFNGTKIAGPGLVHFKNLKLDELKLAKTNVDDAAIPHLLAIKSLKSLELDGTKVSREGLKRIKEGLPDCKVTR